MVHAAAGLEMLKAFKDVVRDYSKRMSGAYVTLMYHRVVDDVNDDSFGISVSTSNFEDHMKCLAEVGSCRTAGSCSWTYVMEAHAVGCVEVTFDDGYADNAHTAMPILKKYEIPATFFLAPWNILNNQPMWYEKVAMLNPAGLAELIRSMQGSCGNLVRTQHPEKSASSMAMPSHATGMNLHIALEGLKTYQPACRDTMINSIFTQCAFRADKSVRTVAMMNPQQVAEMAVASNVTIGSHGLSHSRFSVMDEEAQFKELLDSRVLLESMTGRPVTQFAFPFGRPGKDYTGTSMRLARRAGYSTMYSTVPTRRYLHHWNTALPRFEVKDWSKDVFVRKLHDWMKVA